MEGVPSAEEREKKRRINIGWEFWREGGREEGMEGLGGS